MSVDPLFSKYPASSPYHFAANSPIMLVDINGLWVGQLSPDGKSVLFIAEKGDNLSTLAVQLGVEYADLLKTYPNRANWKFTAGTAYAFAKVPQVAAMNNYLKRDDVAQTNCSNCAMGVNDISQENAWPKEDDGGTASVNAMENARENIDNNFENIPESESKVGDVVTFQISKEAAQESGDIINQTKARGLKKGTPEYDEYVNTSIKNADIAHYGVVLLKTKDGQKIQQILEKPGREKAAVSKYPPKSGPFTPAPANGNNTKGTPVYTKKK